MTRELASIEFESRAEVRELMRVIDEYVKQNPKEKENATLERFHSLLYGFLRITVVDSTKILI